MELAIVLVTNERCVYPRPTRKPGTPGKADPIWGTAFTTKFSKKPVESEELVQPKGSLPPGFDRLTDIEAARLEQCCPAHARGTLDTEHSRPPVELASTLSLLRANGISGFSLQSPAGTLEADNIAEADGTPYGDPGFLSAMQRRIDWERAWWLCGNVTRTRLALTDKGTVGIEYQGGERKPSLILEEKRWHKQRIIELFGTLPEPEALAEALAFQRYYKAPVLPLLAHTHERDSQLPKGWWRSHSEDEDPDPGRLLFHTDEDPKPVRSLYATDPCSVHYGRPHTGCRRDGNALYELDLRAWEARQPKHGYAGPETLGTDKPENDPDFSDFIDTPAEERIDKWL